MLVRGEGGKRGKSRSEAQRCDAGVRDGGEDVRCDFGVECSEASKHLD